MVLGVARPPDRERLGPLPEQIPQRDEGHGVVCDLRRADESAACVVAHPDHMTVVEHAEVGDLGERERLFREIEDPHLLPVVDEREVAPLALVPDVVREGPRTIRTRRRVMPAAASARTCSSHGRRAVQSGSRSPPVQRAKSAASGS